MSLESIIALVSNTLNAWVPDLAVYITASLVIALVGAAFGMIVHAFRR